MNKLFLGVISLLLCFSASLAFAGECLTDNGDGTLTDPNTGLIWQNCAVGETWNGNSCAGSAKTYSWADAHFVANGNRFQNKNDWILPTQGQYEGLFNSYCKRWTNGIFWSSTKNDHSSAWNVLFGNGRASGDFLDRDSSFAVRLVRASQVADLSIFNASLNEAKGIQKREHAYEAAKRASTVVGYIDFLRMYPDSDHSSEAKDQIRNILEQTIVKAEATFKCEEARQLDKQTDVLGISHLSNFDSCVDKRKFNNVLNLKNPQQQYLEAVKYENENERSRAKRVYLTIMDKFSTSPVAMKAADRIASLKDVEAVESASSASQAAAERAAEASRRAGAASRDAANTVNRKNSEQCQNNRNACYSGCDVYKNYSQRNSCQSGCAMCAN